MREPGVEALDSSAVALSDAEILEQSQQPNQGYGFGAESPVLFGEA